MSTKFLSNEITKFMNHLDYDFLFDELIGKNNDDYEIEIPVPGLSKDDLKITATNYNLLITINSEEKSKFIRFTKKKYLLPKDVDVNKINAKVENGVCFIKIPKDKKKSGEREITVN
jgi:HSP20 family protein